MQNPFSMEDRNILVTGAAQGIGREVAQSVVGLGGRVAAVDMNGDGLKSLKEELGDACLTYTGSVTDQGLTDQVLDDPQHAYTQLLVSSVLQV